MTKNCKNCMWGDKCSTADECDYYDPLNEDESDGAVTQMDRQIWQDYLHYLDREEN